MRTGRSFLAVAVALGLLGSPILWLVVGFGVVLQRDPPSDSQIIDGTKDRDAFVASMQFFNAASEANEEKERAADDKAWRLQEAQLVAIRRGIEESRSVRPEVLDLFQEGLGKMYFEYLIRGHKSVLRVMERADNPAWWERPLLIGWMHDSEKRLDRWNAFWSANRSALREKMFPDGSSSGNSKQL